MSVKSERGKAGELHVSRYLEENGWRIAGRNYRVKGGEIDIIADNSGTIAFVEVKTRKFGSLDGDGMTAVDADKRAAVIRAAQRYLEICGTEYVSVRFDVALVTVTTEEIPRVLGMEYYEDAFDAFT